MTVLNNCISVAYIAYHFLHFLWLMYLPIYLFKTFLTNKLFDL